MKVVLIGNKSDQADGDSLVGMNRRQVSTQEARAFASGRGLLYEETSAKDGRRLFVSDRGLLKCNKFFRFVRKSISIDTFVSYFGVAVKST